MTQNCQYNIEEQNNQSTDTVPHFQCVRVQSLSCVQLFATLWTITLQAPLSMEFPRQEY